MSDKILDVKNQVEDTQSGEEMPKVGPSQRGSKDFRRRSKTHVDYWRTAVFKPVYTSGGKRRESAMFSVRICHLGRRENFHLDTANVAEAAEKAKAIWIKLQADGWDAALRKFKPESVFTPPDFVTLGDFIKFVEENAIYSPAKMHRAKSKTFTLVAGMMEWEKPQSAHNIRGGGLKPWHEKLMSVKLVDLTPRRLELFRLRYFKTRSETRAREIAAQHTYDSYLRSAKALFGVRMRKLLENLQVKLPEPVPFASALYTSRGKSSYRYRSRIDPRQLTANAITELSGPKKIEQLKIFLLALHLGLRRGEIDRLLWSQFDFNAKTLCIEETEFVELKTTSSAGVISLEPELASFFEAQFKSAGGIFVINAPNAPRRTKGWCHYRAHRELTQLCGWLRAQGVTYQKPLHTLRKEFGKLIAEKLGLYAASLALRHSSMQVTATFYADDTRPKHTGLGALLAPLMGPVA